MEKRFDGGRPGGGRPEFMPHGAPGEAPERGQFRDAAEIRYIKPDEIKFYETEGGLPAAVLDGKDWGRICAYRLFPMQMKDKFISIRRMSEGHRDRNTELGIIEDLAPFGEEARKIIDRELDRRYFVPEIVKVKNAKEEFGQTYWECVTSAGERSFTTNDMSSALTKTGEYSLILTDVDGSRYEIKDIRKVGDKAMKILDIWL
ncbi:MAG: DUF1854 domain-containing protein [Clostridia bacterium]|nr:DUF1854 domain-containing protein [Clostridia bacterium]